MSTQYIVINMLLRKSVNFDDVILFRENNSHENSIIIDLSFLAAFTAYWFRWWNSRIVVATVVAEKNSNYACHSRFVGRIPTICLLLHKRALINENLLRDLFGSLLYY